MVMSHTEINKSGKRVVNGGGGGALGFNFKGRSENTSLRK